MTWWFWLVLAVVLLFGFVVVRGAPYVPSHRRFVRQALTKLYTLDKNDVLVDLGSGDGLVLRMAAEYGARAVGYELNPALVFISQVLARGNPHISTHLGDMWFVDLPTDTTVVYIFGVSRDTEKFSAKLQMAANKNAQKIWCITYGAKLPNKKSIRELDAHTLYLFEPDTLQAAKA